MSPDSIRVIVALGRPSVRASWELLQTELAAWSDTMLISDRSCDYLRSRSDEDVRRGTPHVIHLAMNAWGNQLLAYADALDGPWILTREELASR
jgi:hypothetical protein